ncbi:MAG: TetR/AcrR family transcriptional regulator [Caulobacter sp.]|nr:TetR/AcrR family transcriptional regulator [Caulobacter sp.]
MITKISRPRGRPRRLDAEQAVATAQRLFHSRGYDAVSVSDVTQELSIHPPSLYSAFGNKVGLYARALERYGTHGAIPLSEILRDDRPVAEALAEVLEEAARRYADPNAAGCLVLEGARCNDPEARELARAYNRAAEQVVRHYISTRHPEAADSIADFVSTTMSGLSAKARDGYDVERLLASARLAGATLRQALR